MGKWVIQEPAYLEAMTPLECGLRPMPDRGLFLYILTTMRGCLEGKAWHLGQYRQPELEIKASHWGTVHPKPSKTSK